MAILALMALAAAPLASQVRDTTLRVEPGIRVEVSSLTQPIMVTGTSGNQLTVRGASIDGDKNHIDIDGQLFGKGTKGPIILQVPTTAHVVINTMSGPVTVVNAPDHLEIEAVDGPVSVTGGRGEMAISAIGEISITDFTGTTLSIEGVAGGITVRGASGSLEIENVNGQILLERIASRAVQINSVNGQIRWRGDFDPAGHYTIESHNGGVELTVPSTLSAKLQIETFNGGFSSEIPARVTGDATNRNGFPTERDITATYGRGQATIEITTFNAGIQVRKLGGN